ncbi:cell agglutination protein Mam3 [Savitreella phatthalungensis]
MQRVSHSRASAGLAKVALLLIACLRSLASHPLAPANNNSLAALGSKPEEPPGTPTFWWKLGLSVVLILGGGVFAGLTIGLMGQDIINLQVLVESGEKHERKHAKKVLSLLKRGKHWVLVTLLLSNVLTNETLPIVMDSILPGGLYAIGISTVSIVIFGEIIPQALCVRYGLAIGAAFVPPVLFMMYVMYPIAYPVAKLLDYLLGDDEGTVYKKAGLKTLVTLHKTLGVDRLNEDEVTIITAVLDLKEKNVDRIMTPIEDVFTMSADTILDERMVDTILREGYSRIPVYQPGNPTNFVGMLLVKILITYDPEDCVPVSNFTLATLPECSPEVSCLDILNFFQEGKSHMVLISDHPGEPHGALGLLTCEDIIEELIGEEILDETDVYIDVHAKLKRTNAPTIRKGHRINYAQLDRRVSSLAASGTRTSFKPANAAHDPVRPRSNKVTIKTGTADGLSPARSRQISARESPIPNERTGLRTPGHPDRQGSLGPADADYGTTSERAAIHNDLARSPARQSGKLSAGDESETVDESTALLSGNEDESEHEQQNSKGRRQGQQNESLQTVDRRKSRVRSGSIVETSFIGEDGTRRVIVEADHSGHAHGDSLDAQYACEVQQRQGIRVPSTQQSSRHDSEADSNDEDDDHQHHRHRPRPSSTHRQKSSHSAHRDRTSQLRRNDSPSEARDRSGQSSSTSSPKLAKEDSASSLRKILMNAVGKPTSRNGHGKPSSSDPPSPSPSQSRKSKTKKGGKDSTSP